jgi:ATP-dependent RNA helicase DDX21
MALPPARSGRTGRAGRKGICVTFFSPRYRAHVKEIEAAVGNKFEWAGAPQPKDIIAASADGVLEVCGSDVMCRVCLRALQCARIKSLSMAQS